MAMQEGVWPRGAARELPASSRPANVQGHGAPPVCAVDDTVMSTDQVLSLIENIDGFSDDLAPLPQPPLPPSAVCTADVLPGQAPARLGVGFPPMPSHPAPHHAAEPPQRWSAPGHASSAMPGLPLRTGCSGELSFLEL